MVWKQAAGPHLGPGPCSDIIKTPIGLPSRIPAARRWAPFEDRGSSEVKISGCPSRLSDQEEATMKYWFLALPAMAILILALLLPFGSSGA